MAYAIITMIVNIVIKGNNSSKGIFSHIVNPSKANNWSVMLFAIEWLW